MEEKILKELLVNGVCLEDPNISLEAKGLYYSIIMSFYNNKKSLTEILEIQNYDKDYIYGLVIELVEHGYINLSIKNEQEDSSYIVEA